MVQEQQRDRLGAAPSVLVVGAGAIGVLYGGLLARAGARVSVVSRSEAEQVRRDGYEVRSPLGDFRFQPAQVLQDVAEAAGAPPDYLLLSVKTVRSLDRAALIRPAVGPATTLVLIANGIGVEQEIADAFAGHELISVLAYVAASRTGPGQIQHHALGALAMGDFPRGSSPRVAQLAALLRSSGITVTDTENIQASRWHKNLWNIAFNPISVLGGTLDTRSILAPAEGEALVRRVMEEMRAVAGACGYPLPPEAVEENIRSTRAMAPYRTSMALDHAHGREMEVEPIIGNVVRLAQAHGVAVPALQTLYALLRMVQERGHGAG